MARRRNDPGSPPDLAPERAIELLRRQLEVGQILLNGGVPEDGHQQWVNTTGEFVNRAFGSASSNSKAFDQAGEPLMWSLNGSDSYYARLRHDSLTGKMAILKSCIEQLEVITIMPGDSRGHDSSGKCVFLVHGREEGVRETVARFLESLDLPVTILHEQPNKGRTIIEKFEAYADVGFAVVLLTGDDKGGLATEPVKGYRPRARQNVLLELGFFLGKIGRERVCALYEPGVEIPSDYSGVVFVELDPSRRWHLELVRELKAAGFEVDLNRLVK